VGISLCGQWKLTEAEPFLFSGYGGARQAISEAPPLIRPAMEKTVSDFTEGLRLVLRESGALAEEKLNLAEARARYHEALSLQTRLLGSNHIALAAPLADLAWVLQEMGRPSEAEPLFREVHTSRQRQYGVNALETAGAAAPLVLVLLQGKKFGEAEPFARECLRVRQELRPDDWPSYNAQSLLGGSLLGQKKLVESEKELLAGYTGMKKREGEMPAGARVRLKEAMERLIQLYEVKGDAANAAEWRKKLQEFPESQIRK